MILIIFYDVNNHLTILIKSLFMSYYLLFLIKKVHQNNRSYHNICHSRRRSHLDSIQPYNLIQPFSRDMIISPWIPIWQLDFTLLRRHLDAFAHPLKVGEQEKLINNVCQQKRLQLWKQMVIFPMPNFAMWQNCRISSSPCLVQIICISKLTVFKNLFIILEWRFARFLN